MNQNLEKKEYVTLSESEIVFGKDSKSGERCVKEPLGISGKMFVLFGDKGYAAVSNTSPTSGGKKSPPNPGSDGGGNDRVSGFPTTEAP